MKTVVILLAVLAIPGCMTSNWPVGAGGGVGYGYPAYGYRPYPYPYAPFGYGYPGYGWSGYAYGYDTARKEDWRRWQAYQYGLSQGQQGQSAPPSPPYGITKNQDGTYQVPGHGNLTPGQIQNWWRKHRR